MKQTVEEAAREAIHKHYNCNGTYPCSEREYCEHCNGHNTAFDCCECGADEFKKGFIAGANWRINSVWHDASERPDTDKGDLLVIVKDAFGKDVYVRQNAYYVLKYGCVRWAYIKDLIPNNEHFKV